MLTQMRAGLMAALALFASFIATVSCFATDKPYQRSDLADAAIRLEGQLRTEAGAITKPPATLRRETDQAATRADPRAVLPLIRQIAVAAPSDAANWLRLARTMMQIAQVAQVTPLSTTERFVMLQNAAAAAYIAYQRTSGGAKASAQEAEALSLVGQSFALRSLWRPALDALRVSLELREVAEVRTQYDKLRDDHGFRLLDYSVDADSASPRACFQFSEALPGKYTDFLPYVGVSGQDKPALSVDDKQLCVESLVHGENYDITLRAGLPSTVRETLAKNAVFSIYVRDRSPFVRFTTKAYVLPRTGQRGIPVVTVNTQTITIKIHRIGDRNLLEALGRDFQTSLNASQLQQIAATQGVAVWNGELKVESPLNAEVTTAFPVDEAVGNLAPGVYVMTAEPEGPKKDDDYSDLATQWFIVSDLGVTTFSGHDGIHVFVNSLATAAASAQTEVRLIARNNEVLATKHTDSAGHAVFEAGFARGEGGMTPALLVVTDSHGDYAFLNLTGPAFDFSDRGVASRAVAAGLDAFVYTERGVYRTGETVHVTALLRDPTGLAATAPLTLVIERPDGVEYRRAVVADQGLGGRNLDVAIAPTATAGTWRVHAFSDPRRQAIGEASFMVEDYVPDRIEFDLASKAKAAAQGRPFEVTVEGRFLYGAAASDLDITGKVRIVLAAGRPGFDGYQFGVTDDGEGEAVEQPLEDLPQTDRAGKAKFDVTIDKVPQTTRPLEAQVTVSMAEPGGRAIERKLALPVTPPTAMLGVKSLFAGGSLGEHDNAAFDVVVVAPDGAAAPRAGLRYTLQKIEHRYQWYRQNGTWNYEPIKQTKRVADGTLDVTAGQPGRISVPVVWGRYRLEVSSPDGSIPATAVAFDAGFYAEASADTPDLLETALDKAEYSPGESMTIAVTAPTAGKVILNIVTDRVVATVERNAQPGLNQIRVPVGRDWGNGGYVVTTLLRPLEAAAKRMPGRAIGVQWFSVERKAKTLAINMELPQLARPSRTLQVPLKIDGLAGHEARLVVAAVDVGILNLTGYKPPSPDDHFLGQRRLTTEVRDLYGQLIDGMQATRGQIRSGGDSAAAELQGSPPTQPPVALYSSIVTVGRDGTAEVSFDIPEFAGTVRVMAVAWSRDKVGHAVADVTVRDPVVATATLPRFVLVGDRSNLQLELDNVEGPAGEYRVEVEADGPVRLGPAPPRSVQLRPRQRNRLSIALTAPAAGAADLKVRLAGPDSFTLDRTWHLAAKPATRVLTRRTVRTIAPGESLMLSGELFSDLVAGTGSVALSVGPSTALDVATLLKALDRYPFGCSEQITSQALPLLYVNELAVAAHLALDAAVDQRIRDAIERLMARQGSNGSFGLWSAGGDDAWLDGYVTDFLTRARERGFAVPDPGFRLALDRLRNVAVNAPEPGRNGGRDLAYALYVLARNGVAPLGDLRYIADAKLDDVATPIAKAQIAAALGLMGDRLRAERAYTAALETLAPPKVQVPSQIEVSREDYGSNLRDAAAVVMLAAEGNAPQPTIIAAVQKVEAAREAAPVATSTQENAWMVLAALAIGKQARMSLDIGGEALKRPLYRTISAGELQAHPFKVTNAGDAPVRAVVSVSGAPVTPEPAAERGFKIERAYYTLDGKPVADLAKTRQNQRLAVVLTVTEPTPQYGRLMIADYLPAGFEIDNPRLVSSGDTGTLSWIENAAEPVYSEFRDDHFAASFDRDSTSPAVFAVAYVVRAVSPGIYVLPQASVEDMYRPDRYGRTATGTVTVVAAAR
jgi:alpha-2-macroglobulin